MFIAVGGQKLNSIRREKYLETKDKGYSFINFIRTNAKLFPNVSIGENVFVGGSCSLSPFVTIGNNVILIDSVNAKI